MGFMESKWTQSIGLDEWNHEIHAFPTCMQPLANLEHESGVFNVYNQQEGLIDREQCFECDGLC